MCPFPLYHGTDKRILAMSRSERDEMKMACRTVIEYAQPIMKCNGFGSLPVSISIAKLGDYRYQVQDAYITASGMLSNLNTFQYDNIYMTFSPEKAGRYAMRAKIYGELGYAALWLCVGLKMLDYPLPPQTAKELQAINRIAVAAEAIPAPEVLVFHEIQKSQLLEENGAPLDTEYWSFAEEQLSNGTFDLSVRILNPFDLSIGRPLINA